MKAQETKIKSLSDKMNALVKRDEKKYFEMLGHLVIAGYNIDQSIEECYNVLILNKKLKL